MSWNIGTKLNIPLHRSHWTRQCPQCGDWRGHRSFNNGGVRHITCHVCRYYDELEQPDAEPQQQETHEEITFPIVMRMRHWDGSDVDLQISEPETHEEAAAWFHYWMHQAPNTDVIIYSTDDDLSVFYLGHLYSDAQREALIERWLLVHPDIIARSEKDDAGKWVISYQHKLTAQPRAGVAFDKMEGKV